MYTGFFAFMPSQSIESKESGPPIEIHDDFSFSTSSVSVGYAIITPSSGVFNPAFYTFSKDVTVNFDERQRHIEIKLHKDLSDRVKTGAASAFPKILEQSQVNNNQ